MSTDCNCGFKNRWGQWRARLSRRRDR